MFERYTEQARRILFFARFEASQFGSASIDTEHILLGLIREAKGITRRVFEHSHISLENIRIEVEGRLERGEKIPTSVEIPFTRETKRVLQCAAEEADRLHHSYIGSEHLLLGLLREESSVAASVLLGNGMRLETARQDIVRLLGETPGPPSVADVVKDIDGPRVLEGIRGLVQQLARSERNSVEAGDLLERILQEIDALKTHARNRSS